MPAVDLTVLCWDHPRCTTPVQAAAKHWARLHPLVRLHITARPLAAFNDQPITEIAASADLLFVDHPMVGMAADSGALVPLEGLLDGQVLAALKSDSVGASHDSYLWQGQQLAMAVDAACQVAVVDESRSHLLGGQIPRQWEDVLQLARRAPGTVAIPLYPSDALLSLLSITANLRAQGEASDGPWSLEAVRVLTELVRWVDPHCFDLTPPRMLDLMSAGSAEGAPVYVPLLFGYANYQRPTTPGRRLTFCDAPSFGDAPAGAVLGGAGLAVSAQSDHPQEAAQFAAWMAGTNAQRDVVLTHEGQPASRAVWHDSEADALVGGFFSGTRATMQESYVRPRDAWWPAYQEAAGLQLVQALRSKLPPNWIHRDLTRLFDQVRNKELAE